MSPPDERARRTLAAAERVHAILADLGIPAVVIGAIAAAVYGHVRATMDFDFATFVDPFRSLAAAARALRAAGFDVELREPDADDPLGGLLHVTGGSDDFDPIEVVNFLNPVGRARSDLGEEAVRTARPPDPAGGLRLPVVGLAHLIALKLYAGGAKNKLDVIELLQRNAPLDLAPVRDVCGRHGLGPALEAIAGDLGL